jgi:chemotaxis response regulator CheB
VKYRDTLEESSRVSHGWVESGKKVVDDASNETGKPAIVAIGASAGGVRALQAFFEAVPADTGAAFVVVVHLDPSIAARCRASWRRARRCRSPRSAAPKGCSRITSTSSRPIGA